MIEIFRPIAEIATQHSLNWLAKVDQKWQELPQPSLEVLKAWNPDILGKTALFSILIDGTQYVFLAKTRTIVGNSSWFSIDPATHEHSLRLKIRQPLKLHPVHIEQYPDLTSLLHDVLGTSESSRNESSHFKVFNISDKVHLSANAASVPALPIKYQRAYN